MKHSLLLVFICFYSILIEFQLSSQTKNVFIVTIDGIRWQEIFKGAKPQIINDPKYTPNSDLAKLIYFDSYYEENHKKLMPFFWNVIQKNGQLLGNRLYKNDVNISNPYKFSYLGYNEIFTG